MMISLEEYPKQIISNSRSLGLDLEKNVESEKISLYYNSPIELQLDCHFEKIVSFLEKYKVKRVIVDSLAAYESAEPKEAHAFIYALSTYFKNNLITAILNYESPELLGLLSISEHLKASAIVDNIILLNYVEISTQLRRAITVPKARGTAIPQKTREYVIGCGGIRLLDEEKGGAGKLEGVPQLPFSSYYAHPLCIVPLLKKRSRAVNSFRNHHK